MHPHLQYPAHNSQKQPNFEPLFLLIKKEEAIEGIPEGFLTETQRASKFGAETAFPDLSLKHIVRESIPPPDEQKVLNE